MAHRDAWIKPEDREKRSKYHNVKVTFDGYNFDSLKEMRRYQDLRLMMLAGTITDLKLHTRWVLLDAFRDRNKKRHMAIVYESDFDYLESGNPVRIVEDVKGGKGTVTEGFLIKMKMLLFRYPEIDFRLLEGKTNTHA